MTTFQTLAVMNKQTKKGKKMIQELAHYGLCTLWQLQQRWVRRRMNEKPASSRWAGAWQCFYGGSRDLRSPQTKQGSIYLSIYRCIYVFMYSCSSSHVLKFSCSYVLIRFVAMASKRLRRMNQRNQSTCQASKQASKLTRRDATRTTATFKGQLEARRRRRRLWSHASALQRSLEQRSLRYFANAKTELSVCSFPFYCLFLLLAAVSFFCFAFSSFFLSTLLFCFNL